ncbi:MAG: DUF1178 family protein [Sulfitobacter sp.]
MIKYALTCAQGHEFESWFQSAAGFETLAASGHLSCAICGSGDVKKALMAPKITHAPKAPETPAVQKQPQQVLARPDSEIEKALKELRRKVEKNADYVGRDFAREARAMHLGDSPERAIYGEAKPEDARALIEEGVPVAPLPFMPKRNTN